MMHVFLHLHEREQIVIDEEGYQVRDLDEARELAIEAARSLMAADILRGRLNLLSGIDIADGSGTSLAFVRFGDAVSIDAL